MSPCCRRIYCLHVVLPHVQLRRAEARVEEAESYCNNSYNSSRQEPRGMLSPGYRHNVGGMEELGRVRVPVERVPSVEIGSKHGRESTRKRVTIVGESSTEILGNENDDEPSFRCSYLSCLVYVASLNQGKLNFLLLRGPVCPAWFPLCETDPGDGGSQFHLLDILFTCEPMKHPPIMFHRVSCTVLIVVGARRPW